jgi:hypothetical protein
MAIKACRECGKEVSTQAGKCPHCGVSAPTMGKAAQSALGALFLLAIVGIGFGVAQCSQSDQKTSVERRFAPDTSLESSTASDVTTPEAARAWLEPLRGTDQYPLVQPARRWNTYPAAGRALILTELYGITNEAFGWNLTEAELRQMEQAGSACMATKSNDQPAAVLAGDLLEECNAVALAALKRE